MADYRKEAKGLILRGISVTPLTTDGSKQSKIKWLPLKSRFLTDYEIEMYCKDCGGLAAITGDFSKLVCIDFDLDKQLPEDDYWGKFCEMIPAELQQKFLVNTTRSGGKHIWLRTEGFCDTARKITHRYKSIEELYQEFILKKNEPGTDVGKLQRRLLNKPLKCIIETRFEGTYAVILHDSYKRTYGDKIQSINYSEWKTIEEALYKLDCGYIPRSKYCGDGNVYALICKYNSETDGETVAEMMCSTGGYEISGTDSEGNILLRREGSNNRYSSKVFQDSGNVIDHGESNVFSDDKKSHTPFEVFCAVNGLDEDGGIEAIKEIYNLEV